ncbi:MAG TPA: ABC transporter ATP-binding protein, partial [Nitrosopumilaceae archaeon]|nr:ABC transporter ATP-binding protein [Nitrosopumilaceae archaeon]
PLWKGLNLMLSPGNFIGLIGNNGVGKSTVLKTICGILPPLGGSIMLGNKKVSDYDHRELSKLVSVVLTDKVEGFNLRIYDLVAAGRYPYTNYLGELTVADRELIEKYISLCGIDHIKYKNISEVSDGERQKAMIAKALTQQTPLILLDEPTAFLDYSSKNNVTELLKNIAHQENKIVILSSHDLEMLLRNVDYCLLLGSENKSVFGTPKEILETEEMKRSIGNFKFAL